MNGTCFRRGYFLPTSDRLMSVGFVYVLASPNSRHVKIGGTEHPLMKRLREINGTASYATGGPWALSDFLHVTEWQLVERQLHERFRNERVSDVVGTRELFNIPVTRAREALQSVEPPLRIGHGATSAMFRDHDLKLYLFRLLDTSGLFGELDIQGSWTLTLFPSTNRKARSFTLNIRTHEVAFSTRIDGDSNLPWHRLVVDALIRDYSDTVMWLGRHDGEIIEAPYSTAWGGAMSVGFTASYADAEEFFGLPGAQRAILAYWKEGLSFMRARGSLSPFAQSHNYDAVEALFEYARSRQSAVARQ